MTTIALRTIIVDDEPPARKRLRSLLAPHADFMVVAECDNGRSAVQAIEQERPDAVFLDVEMPKLKGVDIPLAISFRPAPAIVFVTAYSEHAIEAFDLSAVDYLLKPYDAERFDETLERVRTYIGNRQIREAHARLLATMHARHGAAPTEDMLLSVGDLRVDLSTREVRRGPKSISLRPREFDLLVCLIGRAGRVVDRRQVLREVWGYQESVVSRTVDTHLAELRRKLGHRPHEAGYIETVHRIGYRLRL